jgi:hypothetical protein
VLLEHFHDSSVLDCLEEHSSPVSHPPLSSKVPKSLNLSFRVSTLPMQHWPLSSQKTLWNSFSGGLALCGTVSQELYSCKSTLVSISDLSPIIEWQFNLHMIWAAPEQFVQLRLAHKPQYRVSQPNTPSSVWKHYLRKSRNMIFLFRICRTKDILIR